jgi:hypothetical protein
MKTWRTSKLASVALGLTAIALGGAVAIAQVPPPTRPPETAIPLICGKELCIPTRPDDVDWTRPTPGSVTEPRQPVAPPRATADAAGVPLLSAREEAQPGRTYRVALTNLYLTPPPGRPIRYDGITVNGAGMWVRLVDVFTDSYYFIGVEDNDRTLRFPGGSDPQAAKEALDALSRGLRKAQ